MESKVTYLVQHVSTNVVVEFDSYTHALHFYNKQENNNLIDYFLYTKISQNI